MDKNELRREYNRILKRIQSGEAYIDTKAKPEEYDRIVAGYKQLIKKANELLELLKQLGVSWDEKEVLGGFYEIN